VQKYNAMLSILYPIGFLASLSGLILWFYFQANRRLSRTMSGLFLGGFFVYLFSLAFAEGELSYKLLILFRDLTVLGVVSQFFGWIRKYKVAFFVLLAILYSAFYIKFFDVMLQTFPQDQGVVTSEAIDVPLLDPQGEFLVEVSEGADRRALKAYVEANGFKLAPAFELENPEWTELDDFWLVNTPDLSAAEVDEVLTELSSISSVEYVELNEQVLLDDMEYKGPIKLPVKPYLNDPDLNHLWGFQEMKVQSLYDMHAKKALKPKKKAKLFILDTGVDSKHEDLKDRYTSVKKKYDNDPRGHGTHCAGIAAAVTNNKIGVASFAPTNDFVEITSIKVLSAFGGGTQRGIIQGMLEAADNGADVVSMSLGGRSNPSRTKAYKEAVDYINKKGGIVVVAAGNSNMDAKDFSPANTPGVITVSAIDTSLNRASFSNYVQNVGMGIGAPGVKIYSTIPGDEYAIYNGTSMACPYVAGLVGVMKSLKPNLTTKQAYQIMTKTGKQLPSGDKTGPLIQPANAIQQLLK